MVNSYDAVVIGGGHNGLVAAAYLARSGLRTALCEARGVVGGAAVTERPWGSEYRVTSLSYVVSLLAPGLVQDLQLERHGYKVYPQGPYFVPYASGGYLQLPDDPAARREQISKFSAADADAMERWDAWMHDLAGVLGPLLSEIPPRLGSHRPFDLAAQARLACGCARSTSDAWPTPPGCSPPASPTCWTSSSSRRSSRACCRSAG